MLLKRNLHDTITMELRKTGATIESQDNRDITPASATAPAGDCTERVYFMRKMMVETAVAITHGSLPGDSTNITLTKAPIGSPMTTFRGCASGLLRTPKTSTDVAPIGAAINGYSLSSDRCAKRKMPTKLPTHDSII